MIPNRTGHGWAATACRSLTGPWQPGDDQGIEVHRNVSCGIPRLSFNRSRIMPAITVPLLMPNAVSSAMIAMASAMRRRVIGVTPSIGSGKLDDPDHRV